MLFDKSGNPAGYFDASAWAEPPPASKKKAPSYDPNAGFGFPAPRWGANQGGGASAGEYAGWTNRPRNRFLDLSEMQSADAQSMERYRRGLFGDREGFEARLAGAEASRKGAMLTYEIEQMEEKLEEISPILQDLEGAFGRFGDSVLDDFSSISDAAKQLGKDLIRSLWRNQIINPLIGSAEGGGGLLGWVGGLFGGIDAKASGGLARGMTLVGERGPELVDFRRAGMVTSNERIREALGAGSGISLTMNITSADGPAVRAAIAESLPAIASAVKSSVAEDASRPGAFRSQIRGAR